MTRVIIAEKPDMGRKIASALKGPHKNGQGYIETGEGIVTWCIGHIMKSFEPNEYNPIWEKWSFDHLPMLLEEWKIKIEPEKAKQFKIIKELLSTCTEAVNAGDPGREGQLIVDEVLHYLKFKKPVKRVLLYALDKKTITQAFANLQDNKNFHNLYEAGVCRGYADWTMGMNATRAYTMLAQKSGYKGVLSVGRVQSPTLAIVVRRDEEIDNFKPHDYATIMATFSHQNQPFNAYWKPNGTTPREWLDPEQRLINLQAANQISQKILNKPGIIKDYEEKDGKENAPLPFSLSKLQIYASAKWGMGAKEVLDTCQALYEKHELQTYPRTDCQFLPEVQHGDAPLILDHIKNSHPHLTQAVSTANPSLKSVAWDDSKLGDHFGLIPTKKEADLNLLSPNEKKIYQAVCERYVAQFHPPCEYKTAAIIVLCEDETFKANGKIVLKPGWRAIFNNDDDSDEKSNDEQEQVFPNIAPNQQVLCTNSKKQDKKTTPPSRYTEGTLIQAMTNIHTLVSDPEQKKKLKEKKGIGQEATRTGILETLFRRTLLTKQGKQLISSPAARALIHALPKKVTDPALTAVWEDALDRIAAGTITAQTFKEKQNQWITQLIEEAKKTQIGAIAGGPAGNSKFSGGSSSGKVNVGAGGGSKAASGSKPAAKGGKKCPKCGVGQMSERTAKASGKKFMGCNNYPKCDHVEWPKNK
jgi:DNA topoisomerase-3